MVKPLEETARRADGHLSLRRLRKKLPFTQAMQEPKNAVEKIKLS